MLIGGLQKTSLIDYPDKLAAIIFTAGCNFRCGFCYNPELVTQIDKKSFIPEKYILNFLEKRKKVLDGAVITGGEPTMHKDLPEFICKIKKMGYFVKLDTNGTNPKMLEKLINNKLINYIAMDIKGPLGKYRGIAKAKVNTKNIKESIKLIMKSELNYEFRSTILPALHKKQDLERMAKLIKGAEKYYLQKFRLEKKLNDLTFVKYKSYTDKEMKQLTEICKEHVRECRVRA
ncbi:MAG: anaerobic ribonucleoside-triphosphate reductase activating protein [Candidatus Kuenenbacteria bacterium]